MKQELITNLSDVRKSDIKKKTNEILEDKNILEKMGIQKMRGVLDEDI